MLYPHEKYLKYLLSKQWTDAQIRAECESLGLDLPTEDELVARRDAFPEYPLSWTPVLNRYDLEFARWLRELEVLRLWHDTALVRSAKDILTSFRLRRAVEVVLLLNPDPAETRALLKQVKNVRVPSAAVLTAYRDIYWNFEVMSPRQAFSYITQHGDNRPELHFALHGQERSALGAVGIMADLPAPEDALDEALDLSLQLAERARRQVDRMPDAGTIRLMGGLGKLLEARDKQRGGAGADMREKARTFKLGRAHIPAIPSIDDIQGGDLEELDAADIAGDAG